MQISLINGQAGSLSLEHRAVGYGDGLFETILFQNQTFMFLPEHLQRLQAGAQILSLPWGTSDTERLIQKLTLLLSGESEPHVVKVMLLRQFPGRGYAYDAEKQTADVVIQIMPYAPPEWCKSGVHTHLAQTPATENKVLAGLKHLNRLDSVLARAEFNRSEYQEVLLADSAGSLVEGSMSNVVLYINGKWVTPRIDRAGVNGIVRQTLIQQHGIHEAEIALIHLQDVESAFICGSLIGIVPVLSYNRRPLIKHSDAELLKQKLGFLW